MSHTPEHLRTDEVLNKVMHEEFLPLVNGRPIGIIAPGRTLKALDDNIELFRKVDLCWGTLNHHPDAATVLGKIGKKCEFMCSYPDPYRNQPFDGLLMNKAQSRGSTGQEFLMQCIAAKLPVLILCFGYEGNTGKEGEAYYKGRNRHAYLDQYIKDTITFNTTFPSVEERAPTRIYQACPGSLITTMENISIQEALKLAKKELRKCWK